MIRGVLASDDGMKREGEGRVRRVCGTRVFGGKDRMGWCGGSVDELRAWYLDTGWGFVGIWGRRGKCAEWGRCRAA